MSMTEKRKGKKILKEELNEQPSDIKKRKRHSKDSIEKYLYISRLYDNTVHKYNTRLYSTLNSNINFCKKTLPFYAASLLHANSKPA